MVRDMLQRLDTVPGLRRMSRDRSQKLRDHCVNGVPVWVFQVAAATNHEAGSGSTHLEKSLRRPLGGHNPCITPYSTTGCHPHRFYCGIDLDARILFLHVQCLHLPQHGYCQ